MKLPAPHRHRRSYWKIIRCVLLFMALFGASDGALLAQGESPCDSIQVMMKYEGQGCCWQFVLANNQSTYRIDGVTAIVLTPGVTVESASAPFGVPTTTSSSIVWSFPNNLPSYNTQTGMGACFSSPGGSVMVELVYSGQGRIFCRDTVTFDCPERPQGCFTISDQKKVECITLPTGQPGYALTFMVQNQSSWPVASLTLSAPGLTFSPSPIVFAPALAPGAWGTVSVTVVGATPGVRTITGVLCDTTRKNCCEGRFEITFPECRKEGCLTIGQQSVLCRYNQNNQIEFVWSFNLLNQSSWPATYLDIVSLPSGVTVSPATVILGTIAPGTWSPMQTVVIAGPGAVPGSTITLVVKMCDRSRQHCCEQTLRVILPDDCKPKDCCSDFRKGIKATSSASSSGSVTLSGYLGAIGTGGSSIVKVEATLANVSVNGAPVHGYFQNGSISNPFGIAFGVPAPYGHEVIWPTIPTGVSMASATPFTLKMSVPPLAWSKKRDTLRYCVRFRFTDKNCVTCDTLICYTTVRNQFIIWQQLDLRKGMPLNEKGSERTFQGAADGAGISGGLHGSDSGSIMMVLPDFPEGLSASSYVGLAIETEGVELADVHAGEPGYEFFVANSRASASFSAAPGTQLSLALRYNALGASTSLPHLMTLYYVVADDTLSEEFTIVLRRDGLVGGDRLTPAPSGLSGVRTYALHLGNSNGSQEPISRLLIGTEGGARILAAGPALGDSIMALGFDGRGGVGTIGPDGIALPPGETSGPIYITVAGAESDMVTIRFATLNAGGQTISTGEVVLSAPLSAVRGAEGDMARGGMLYQSYPNPAAHSATIGFNLPSAGQVTMIVSDVAGREVARPIDGEPLEAGEHAVYLNTAGLPGGTYYYSLRIGTTMETRSMQVIR